jgi:methylated-DNA-[protein]-cysteine S-methyltransferase
MYASARYDAPFGPLLLLADDRAVREIRYAGEPWPDVRLAPRSRLLSSLRRELDRYFAGRLGRFTTRCEALGGTDWQRAVWKALRRVRAGRTIGYAELAARAGRPTAVRAAANANARNPLLIVVPSHRVLGSGGRLVDYDAGIAAKRMLLELEGAVGFRT